MRRENTLPYYAATILLLLSTGSARAALPFAYEMEVIYPPSVIDGLTNDYFASGLNDNGDVVAWSLDADGSIVYSNGVYRTIPDLLAIDINNNGTIAAVLIADFDTYVGTPETGYTLVPDFYPRAINDSGQITGLRWHGSIDDTEFAFYDNGVVTTYGLGDSFSVNEAGVAVAHYALHSDTEACELSIYENGVRTPLPSLGTDCESISRINNLGYFSAKIDGVNYVYEDGAFRSLPLAESQGLDYVSVITDTGIYGGTATDPDDQLMLVDGGDTSALAPLIVEWDDRIHLLERIIDINNKGQILVLARADLSNKFSTVLLTPTNAPPRMDVVGAQTTAENQTLTIDLEALDPEGGQLSWSGLHLPAGGTDEPLEAVGASLDPLSGVFSWTPGFDQAGNYVFEFTVIDDGEPARIDMQTVTVTVGNVNRPPVIEDIAPVTAQVGELLIVGFSISDPDGDIVDPWVTNLPAGAGLSDDAITLYWEPTADQVGTHILEVTATDRGEPPLTVSSYLTVTVGGVFTPAEMIDLLATTILDAGLPRMTEKRLIKYVQKIDKHYSKGKVAQAINETRKMIDDVQIAINAGEIDAATGQDMIDLGEQLIGLLGA